MTAKDNEKTTPAASGTKPNRWKQAMLLFLAFAIALGAYEVFPRVEARLSPRQFPWTEPTEAYISAVETVTLARLIDPTPDMTPETQTGLRLTRKIRSFADSVSARPASWPYACLAYGLIHADGGDKAKPSRLMGEYVDSLVSPEGTWLAEPTMLDDCMIGYALLDLYERTGDERYRKAVDRLAEYLLAGHKRTPTGTLPYRDGQPTLVLVDSLGMIAPFLTRYGRTCSNDAAVELGVAQLAEFTQRGVDPANGLPYHGYFTDKPGGVGLVGWGRGAGWYMVGLADTLAWLPREHPQYESLRTAFVATAETLRDRQTPAGGWRWWIGRPQGSVETSATAMIGYALARGVQTGLLDDSYRPVVDKALAQIVKVTDQYGSVWKGQIECPGPGFYPSILAETRWSQGFALALAGVADALETDSEAMR